MAHALHKSPRMTKKLRLKPETLRPLDLDGVRGGIFGIDFWFPKPKPRPGTVHPDDMSPLESFVGCPGKPRP